MGKINSLVELKNLRQAVLGTTSIRVTGERDDRIIISVDLSENAVKAGSKEVLETINNEIKEKKIDIVSVIIRNNLGESSKAPVVEVKLANKEVVTYTNVNEKIAKEIIEKHVCNKEVTK